MPPASGDTSKPLPSTKPPSTTKPLSNTNPLTGTAPVSTLAHTPISVSVLKTLTQNYPNEADATLLVNGFTFGFRIPYSGQRIGRFSPNHASAKRLPHVVSDKLAKEVALGRVAGPFPEPPLHNLIVSPIGLTPKKQPGEFRLIFDLSYPAGSSVNDGIEQSLCSVEYAKFDDAIRMIQQLGPEAMLVKVDIQSAFRLLPIHPDDFGLLGMYHDGQFYVDKALPFGCSISCALFEKFSTFLEWLLRKATGSNKWLHYLDDFLAGHVSQDGAGDMLKVALSTFAELGVPVAEDKVEGPTTVLSFLGIELDTANMLARLPQDKLRDLRRTIADVISRAQRKVTLKELQSLIGKLNFACRAVVPGRPFLRRLIDSTCGLKHPRHRRRVTEGMVADLRVWETFLSHNNGVSLFLPHTWEDNDTLHLYTDAAGSSGFGAFFAGHWVCGVWPTEMRVTTKHITFLELFPIVLAIILWGEQLCNRKLLLRCDNQAVVDIISRQTSRDQPCMSLVRELVLRCLQHNILIKARHIPGVDNTIADALSRLQVPLFRKLAPTADATMTPIPTVAWELLRQKPTD